jgi:hypothetical protein
MRIITQLSQKLFFLHWTSPETLAQIVQETKWPHVTVLHWYAAHFSSNHSVSTYHPQEVTAALPGGFGPRQSLTLIHFEFQYCFITTPRRLLFGFFTASSLQDVVTRLCHLVVRNEREYGQTKHSTAMLNTFPLLNIQRVLYGVICTLAGTAPCILHFRRT